MAEKINFTQAAIEKLPLPAAGRTYYADAKTPGLFLAVWDSGVKSFELYKRMGGRPTRLKIGRFPEVTVEQARKEIARKHGGPDLGPTRARREWAALGVDGLGLANEPPASNFTGMPRLTVPMVARLQSFPDNWKFAGPKTHAYRQVGNALPVQLAFTVAKAVRECLA